MMGVLETARTQIEKLSRENKSARETADAKIKEQQARARNRIAHVIVWSFVGTLGAIFALVIVALLIDQSKCSDAACPNSWKDGAEFLGALVASVMLPIVTLVLGYYFGTEQDKS